VCSHVLILKNGEKIADGTLAQVRERFSGGDADSSLEDVFIRATGNSER
jgi:ABC-2 type transport system ATP-binding protein